MTPSFFRKKDRQGVKISLQLPLCISAGTFRLFLLAVILVSVLSSSGQDNPLDKKISVSRQHTTVYQALNLISDRSGCFFIYDSKTIDNDRKVRLEAHNETVGSILSRLFDTRNLSFRVVGKYILISGHGPLPHQGDTARVSIPVADSSGFLIIRGTIRDASNRTPVAFASIGSEDGRTGTVANSEGVFTLKIPADQAEKSLLFTHIGYTTRCVPVSLLTRANADILMDKRIISIQEVIIRYIDPAVVLKKALDSRKLNYNTDPVMLTTFYREGVRKDQRLVSYSDAIFNVYKSSFEFDETHDQVSLLKSRKFYEANTADTVYLKLKAGILAGLQLDIIKSLPEFLDEFSGNLYQYTYSDMVSSEGDDAYAIVFTPASVNNEARYTGTIYIDRSSLAILGADFKVNASALGKVTHDYVQKKSRHLKVHFDEVKYSVSYRKVNGKYYLSHARSDLVIRTRATNRLRSNEFHTYMEIVNCYVDTVDVKKFSRDQIFRPDVIFSDIPYSYDESFWSEFNIITPEESLVQALRSMIGKIEEAGKEAGHN